MQLPPIGTPVQYYPAWQGHETAAIVTGYGTDGTVNLEVKAHSGDRKYVRDVPSRESAYIGAPGLWWPLEDAKPYLVAHDGMVAPIRCATLEEAGYQAKTLADLGRTGVQIQEAKALRASLDDAMEALRAGAAAFADDESLYDGMDLLQAIEHALAAYEQAR